MRRRVMIDEETAAANLRGGGIIYHADDHGGGGGGQGGSRAVSIGGLSAGSRGSRRLTGRASVGFALAPLEEASLKNMRVEVVSRCVP